MLNLAGIFFRDFLRNPEADEEVGEDLMAFVDPLGDLAAFLSEAKLFVGSELDIAIFLEAVHRDRNRSAREVEGVGDVDRADIILPAFFFQHQDAFQIVLGGFEKFHTIIKNLPRKNANRALRKKAQLFRFNIPKCWGTMPLMKKALLLYSSKSGHGQMVTHHDKIIAGLKKAFDVVDECKTKTAEEGQIAARNACGVYDALIIAGGDGTFYNAVNALAALENTPVLGYINNGTIGDIGRNFGIGGSYRKAIKTIQKGEIASFDIMQVNEGYAGYVAAVGAYADIPYITPRKPKKLLGRISYYLLAVKALFKRKKYHVWVEADGLSYEQDVPFVLLMNGTNVGGFYVNNYGNIFDGHLDLYLAKPALFNGLLQFLFHRWTIKRIECKEVTIRTDCPDPWDLDGEAGASGEIRVKLLPKHLRIFSNKGVNP